MFGRRKKNGAFDKTGKTPVIRSSICTGEQVAGFRDEATGKFIEVMMIRGAGDLREFLKTYDLEESEIRREW